MVKYVLASGQSNMVGRGSGGPFDINGMVTCWNNQNDLEDLTNVGDAWVSPDRDENPFVNGRNNLAVHACSHIASRLGEAVRLILVAKGAEPLSTWMGADGTPGPMYHRIAAVLDASGVSSVDYVLWHQGEGGTSKGQWDNLISAWEADGVITRSTPIVIGQLSNTEGHATNNERLLSYANADERVGLALIGDYPTSDGTHFLGFALADIGRVYADVLFRLLAGKPKLPASSLPRRAIKVHPVGPTA